MKSSVTFGCALAAAIVALMLAAPAVAQVSTFDLSGTALDQSRRRAAGRDGLAQEHQDRPRRGRKRPTSAAATTSSRCPSSANTA